MSKSKHTRNKKAGSAPKGPPEGCRQQESRPAQAAGEVQAGRGAWTAEPAERHNDRHHHELHRLAAALGSGFLCRSGSQEARLDARIREGGRRARLSLRAGVAHRPGEALRAAFALRTGGAGRTLRAGVAFGSGKTLQTAFTLRTGGAGRTWCARVAHRPGKALRAAFIASEE